jgi:hypothetical protein
MNRSLLVLHLREHHLVHPRGLLQRAQEIAVEAVDE